MHHDCKNGLIVISLQKKYKMFQKETFCFRQWCVTRIDRDTDKTDLTSEYRS